MRYLILLLATLSLASCITQQKREDIFHRHAREHRADVLDYCPPVKTEVVTGTTDTVTIRDTVTLKVPVVVGTDTVLVDCPTTETIYRYINRTDTLFRENTAAVEAGLIRERNERGRASAMEAERDIYKKQATNRLWLFIAAVVGCVIVIVVRIRGLF